VFVDDRGSIVRRETRQAEQYVEELPGGVGLEMVKIPSGRFLMGSSDTEVKKYGGSMAGRPQHEVNVPSFWMGKFEVTQAQWFALMADYDANNWQQEFRQLDNFLQYGVILKGDNLPIVNVSWNDAKEYCRRLNQRSGKTYRLPSEAEWEYACRAGTATPFHYGDTITTDIANYDGTFFANDSSSVGINRKQTTNVGNFPPNGFGLYDMHGNVSEWCEDDYFYDTYSGAPTDGSAWVIDESKYSRCLRGGNYGLGASFSRSAIRDGNHYYERSSLWGFRVVM
jgi:formylglycine-generating enzyme required for sulfatase activity